MNARCPTAARVRAVLAGDLPFDEKTMSADDHEPNVGDERDTATDAPVSTSEISAIVDGPLAESRRSR